jgi:hypothetical protein
MNNKETTKQIDETIFSFMSNFDKIDQHTLIVIEYIFSALCNKKKIKP